MGSARCASARVARSRRSGASRASGRSGSGAPRSTPPAPSTHRSRREPRPRAARRGRRDPRAPPPRRTAPRRRSSRARAWYRRRAAGRPASRASCRQRRSMFVRRPLGECPGGARGGLRHVGARGAAKRRSKSLIAPMSTSASSDPRVRCAWRPPPSSRASARCPRRAGLRVAVQPPRAASPATAAPRSTALGLGRPSGKVCAAAAPAARPPAAAFGGARDGRRSPCGGRSSRATPAGWSVPQARICPHRRQKRLLEAVVGLLRADGRHQEAVDVVPVLVQQPLERRRCHAH